MASASFIVGIVGNIISILVFTSPIRTFSRIVKKKSVGNYKGLPYITTFLSTSLWTFYGLLKPGGVLIVTVNGAGAVLQFIYVTLFMVYAPRDIKVKMLKLVLLLDVIFLGAVIVVTLLVIPKDLRLTIVGVLCAILTLGMYASPLSVMTTVIRTKSVEYMPFSLSFFLFLNAGDWSVYSVLVKDFFIGVPNAIGFVLGSAQLILYSIYRNYKLELEPEKPEKVVDGDTVEKAKEDVEMQSYEEGGDEEAKTKSLGKGKSLPTKRMSRSNSIEKVIRTVSFGPYELSNWRNEHDF
ncbi:SWEET sugar transporter [Dillenia turbinata]|uniref:Bidirectional sugar transporter SWEET n=1 Tax=Dillenia turbinata TaxID=194707 RepID=A0AAN8UMN6_9MAGN